MEYASEPTAKSSANLPEGRGENKKVFAFPDILEKTLAFHYPDSSKYFPSGIKNALESKI